MGVVSLSWFIPLVLVQTEKVGELWIIELLQSRIQTTKCSESLSLDALDRFYQEGRKTVWWFALLFFMGFMI